MIKTFLLILFLTFTVSAQTFNISGQIKTNAGAGIYNARVHLFSGDCDGDFTITVSSNPFGYYNADVPQACHSLSVIAAHKFYIFSTPRIYIFTIPQTTDITGTDFIAD